MKKSDVKIGGLYAAKVTNKVVPVRIDAVNPRGGWDATNEATGKKVSIKSAQRLRGPWPKKAMPIVAESGSDKANDKGIAETVAAVEKGNLADGVTVPRSKRSAKTAKDARKSPGRDTGERGATGGKKERNSLLNLAAKVLAETGEPLNCKQMVEKILAGGRWSTKGKTPSATLYSAILRETQTKGDAARFRKVERGKFVVAG